MIHGHKPSSYFVTSSGDGIKREGECRQCVHCQFTWEYQPGSGIERGYCLACGGFLCARPQCILDNQKRVDDWLEQTGKVRHCIPFEEWNARLMEKILPKLPLPPDMTVTASGLIVPRS